MNQTQWIKQISISDLVPIMESRAYIGPHVSILVSGAEYAGKRSRSIVSAVLSELDSAEYFIRKTKEEIAFLKPFREWVETGEWAETKQHGASYAFFVSPAAVYWLKLGVDSIEKTESIVAETWHLKPLLNLATHADAKSIRRAIKTFKRQQSRRRTADTLAEVTQYALNGQIKTLMISNARKVWGELNRWNGKMKLYAQKQGSRDDDLLDDLAEIVMRFKGRVLVVPDEWMPTVSPVAAVLK